MTERKKDNNLRPGIPDAIHPEIGNGALWESQLHAYLLRNPDPTKDLEQFLNDPETKSKIIESWSGTMNTPVIQPSSISEEPGEEQILPDPESHIIYEARENETDKIDLTISTPTPPAVSKKSTKAKKSAEHVQDNTEESTPENKVSEEPVTEKTPKAGKRVKKVVKTVRKQEAERKKEQDAETPPPTPSESLLSPFTQWLKGLSGSDYVHPYDEDFAFTQSTGPAKEGISETFADLLAAQGYKERAVEMYQKLIEKYPEKSGFFAAKIKALQ